MFYRRVFTSFLYRIGFQRVRAKKKKKRKRHEDDEGLSCALVPRHEIGAQARGVSFLWVQASKMKTPRTQSLDMSLSNKPKEMDDMMLIK